MHQILPLTDSCNFWTKFARKECFQSKTRKVNNLVQHNQVSPGTKFQIKQKF